MVHSRKLTYALVVGWLLAVCTGMAVLVNYETRPGLAGTVDKVWPAGSALPRPNGTPQLVLFVHPRCPCTRASIRELDRIMAHCRGRLTVVVALLDPSDRDSSWTETDLYDSAAAIPGVQVLMDIDGASARLFGVETSGHAMLYDAHGSLVFSGGITASRGHSGDNDGATAIIEFVRQPQARLSHSGTPLMRSQVFGCRLFHASEQGSAR